VFEASKYVSEPVVQMAIEPKHPKDLPKLVETLRKLTIEDPNLVIKIDEESGETIMAGMGVLHLDVAVNLIKDAKENGADAILITGMEREVRSPWRIWNWYVDNEVTALFLKYK